MEIKNYLDQPCHPCVDETHNDPCEPNPNVSTLDNGCRIKEVVSQQDNEDGTVQEVREVYEEMVPMRLKQRITRTLKCVPVEEKMECIGEDGETETIVKTVDSASMELNKETATLASVANDVRALKAAMTTTTAIPTKRPRNFWWNQAQSKFDGGTVVEEQDVEIATVSWAERTLTVVAWIAFAVVMALVTYAII